MFDIDYFELFKSLPPRLAVVLIAMLPVAELRVSIPVALGVYEMSVIESLFLSVMGDIIVAAIIIYTLGPIFKFFRGRAKWIDNLFEWIFKQTRKNFFHKYAIWGNIALMLFVAIPLPITGAWTASIASWLLGIEKKRSLLYISLGVIIAGSIVTLISLGVISIF